MSLEIRAAFDASLQREIAALRGFIGGKLDLQADRMQGDLAALLPAPRVPDVQASPLIPERRVSSVIGWSLALLAVAGAAAMGWLWWNRGGEIAALKTDLSAAYSEIEILRARPAVIAPAPRPEAESLEPGLADPDAVSPAPDAVSPAPDAQAAAGLQTLVPDGGEVIAPAASSVTDAAAAGSLPAAAAPAAVPPTPAQ
jgi:hypothetical protein